MVCTAQAQPKTPKERAEEEAQIKAKLRNIREAYDAADVLSERGIDTKGIQSNLLAEAKKVYGFDLTYDELAEMTTPPPNVLEKALGFFSFLNVIKVTAAILFTIAGFWLFGVYIIALFTFLPQGVWEVLCYLACGLLLYIGTLVDPDFMLLAIVPGCLGLIGSLRLTEMLHFSNEKTDAETGRKSFKEGIPHWIKAGICAFVWGCVALYFSSQVVAFISVLSLLSMLGFSGAFGPFWIAIGFANDSATFRATAAAFVLLAIHVFCTVTGIANGYDAHVYVSIMNFGGAEYELFRPGLSFLGSFVYFLGLLIMGSKWFWSWRKAEDGPNLYWPMQVVMLVSGVAALYLGSVYNMSMLLGVGGTFFYIYILEKYFEIPWKGAGWAWAALGLSGILYGFVIFAQKNPQFFIFMK